MAPRVNCTVSDKDYDFLQKNPQLSASGLLAWAIQQERIGRKNIMCPHCQGETKCGCASCLKKGKSTAPPGVGVFASCAVCSGLGFLTEEDIKRIKSSK